MSKEPRTKTVIYSGNHAGNSQQIGFKTNAQTDNKKNNMKSSNSGKSYSGGSSYSGGNSYGGSSYGGGYTSTYVSSPHMSPTKAFEFEGVEFWGSAKTKLEKFSFKKGDLIINCTGSALSFRPFIKSKPSFISFNEIADEKPEEILLDWPDFKSPPLNITLDFWKSVIHSAKREGIKRILVCCTAGQGRTGTCLSALALATGAITHHEKAVKYIRYEYSEHAVETQVQEKYLEMLAVSSEHFKFSSQEEREEYQKQFLDDFYESGPSIDLSNFVGKPFSELVEAVKERDSVDDDDQPSD